jgi:hypothetical protein
LLAAMTPAAPVGAEGFFDSLFRREFRKPPAPPPPSASSFADPYDAPGRERRSYSRDAGGASSGSSGHGTAYCVRTCDGRYFPLQRHAAASPAELCKSFCPASQIAVFYGGKIDHAIGPGGTRYADLANAFTYRDKMVENCSCNGKDGLGLARVDIADDASLRSGDIVATNEGLTVVRAGRSRSTEFTPINPSAREWSSRLRGLRVRPAPPPQKITPVADETLSKPARKRNRSAHSR